MPGRELPPSSPFAADDGRCDPALAEVLGTYAAGAATLADVVEALAHVRVLVPVVAALEKSGAVVHEGRTHAVDSEASTGVVAVRAPDGRTALPVFTSVAAMAAWHADARPVPSDSARAALSAVAERWELLVLDPGGPVTVVVPRPAVWALAQSLPWRPAAPGGAGGVDVDPDVRSAVDRAVRSVPQVRDVEVLPGAHAEIAIVLTLVAGLDRERLDVALAAVSASLAADEVVTARVDSLELRLRSGA